MLGKEDVDLFSDPLEDLKIFKNTFLNSGFLCFSSVFSDSLVKRLKCALEDAIHAESPLHRGGIDDPCQVVFCPLYDDVFLTALRCHVFNIVDAFMGATSIIYSYNNSSMLPGSGNFSSHPHIEREYSTGSRIESVGVMILLDEFNVENGATYFWPGSHQLDADIKPADLKQEFYNNSLRLCAPRGSIFFFHPRLWHAGGVNNSSCRRDALSIGFCRPYMKQRLDFPKLLQGRQILTSDPAMSTKLGLKSAIPESINEFYQNFPGAWSENEPTR